MAYILVQKLAETVKFGKLHSVQLQIGLCHGSFAILYYILRRLLSWRHGLHAVSGLAFACFFLGMFFRSATLYHPQRRAILHLKSLKRKITMRNGVGNRGDPKPPMKQVALAFRRRSVQSLFAASVVSSTAAYYPPLYLVREPTAKIGLP